MRHEDKQQPEIVKIMVKEPLTDDDRIRLGSEMTKLLIKKGEVEFDKKRTVGEFNDRIKEIDGELIDMARTTNRGFQEIVVDCRVHFDYAAGVKEMIRMDNDAIVETKKLTDKEKQMSIEDGVPDK